MAIPKIRGISAAAISTVLIAVVIPAVGYILVISNSAKLEKAMAFKEHGYVEAARLELISLIYGPTTWLTLGSDERAAALHLLGQASLEDDQLAGALDAWGLLVDEYPDSQLATSVKEKIAEIETDFERRLSDLKSSVEATRYFEIADRWLEAAEHKAPSPDIARM